MGEFEKNAQAWTTGFCGSSFVIRGIEIIMNMALVDLPNLEYITLGDTAFCDSLSTIIESIEELNEIMSIDLPSLISIRLGWRALAGRKDELCSLTMRSLNEMIGTHRM